MRIGPIVQWLGGAGNSGDFLSTCIPSGHNQLGLVIAPEPGSCNWSPPALFDGPRQPRRWRPRPLFGSIGNCCNFSHARRFEGSAEVRFVGGNAFQARDAVCVPGSHGNQLCGLDRVCISGVHGCHGTTA